MTDLPYGIELIEEFIPKESTQGVDAFAWALGDAMDKASGKYYRQRIEAYKKHFDTVVKKLCLWTVYAELETDTYKLPDYKLWHEWIDGEVRVSISWDVKPPLNLQYSTRLQYLDSPMFFDELRYNIERYFSDKKDNFVYGELWDSLSHVAKDLFIYEFHARNADPFATPLERNELINAGLVELDNIYPMPTQQGYNLLTWLRKTKRIK